MPASFARNASNSCHAPLESQGASSPGWEKTATDAFFRENGVDGSSTSESAIPMSSSIASNASNAAGADATAANGSSSPSSKSRISSRLSSSRNEPPEASSSSSATPASDAEAAARTPSNPSSSPSCARSEKGARARRALREPRRSATSRGALVDAPSAREVTPRRASAVVLAHAAGTAATRLGAPDAVGTACARAANRRGLRLMMVMAVSAVRAWRTPERAADVSVCVRCTSSRRKQCMYPGLTCWSDRQSAAHRALIDPRREPFFATLRERFRSRRCGRT